MLIQQGHFSRIECEMVERKRRQIEVTGRIEQDEILKQVIIYIGTPIMYLYLL